MHVMQDKDAVLCMKMTYFARRMHARGYDPEAYADRSAEDEAVGPSYTRIILIFSHL